jgi:hypothetical protein
LGARGGGAGHRRRLPAAAHGSSSPDFANSGAPVAKSSGVWVCHDQRDTRDPPRGLAGLGEARGCDCDGGGGSQQRSSPACARACGSGHRKGRKRGRTRAQCKGKPKQGDVAAVWCCRELAPVEQRRWNAGVRCSGCRNRLRSTTSSAKGSGGGRDAHRRLGLGRGTVQDGRWRGPSSGDGLESGKKLL